MQTINPATYPQAVKLRIPRGGWASGRSEFKVEGEANRFRYVMEEYKVGDNPAPSGPNGERRLFCRVEGKRGAAVQLFEEMPAGTWGQRKP